MAITIEQIQATVGAATGTTARELKGGRRHQGVSRARAVAMYLARELTGASYPAIGQAFGGKDHSSVIAACRRVARDGNLLASAEALRAILTAPAAASKPPVVG